MSIYAPDPKVKKRKEALVNFLILFPFTIAFLGMALVLGIEPHLKLERTGQRVFRVTGSNHFAGVQFYSKTIEGVEGVRLASAARNDPRDSMQERNRRSNRKRLDFEASNGAVLSWQRTDDSQFIDDFIRGNEPVLSLIGTPPWWRAGLSWLSAGLGVLVFIGTIQNCFFVKK
jgi:hypothetical protein